MKNFKAVNFWVYKDNNDLLDWWFDVDYQALITNDGYYLSDNIYSEKYKVTNSFDELIEYLQELKEG